jgi:hypothetical protein
VSPLILNTLQYLIVDEILLARVLEQSPNTFAHDRYTDEEHNADQTDIEHLDDEQTEYDIRKGRPAIM